ncbi:ChbG/HpnK family deacetylase [Patescibacteria group bacterium]
MKYLIINADDFGYSKVFNEKILELMEKTFLASTSVMIKWIDDEQKNQAERLKNIHKNQDVSVGLHVEFADENFEPQIKEQFNNFISTFGFEPDHVDIHKTVYLQNGYPKIMEFCFKRGIPCKNHDIPGPKAIMTEDPIYDATGKDIDELKKWLQNLEDGKTYVFQVHPGTYDPDSKSSFNEVREIDARNVEAINSLLEKFNIEQVNFKHLKK